MQLAPAACAPEPPQSLRTRSERERSARPPWAAEGAARESSENVEHRGRERRAPVVADPLRLLAEHLRQARGPFALVRKVGVLVEEVRPGRTEEVELLLRVPFEVEERVVAVLTQDELGAGCPQRALPVPLPVRRAMGA